MALTRPQQIHVKRAQQEARLPDAEYREAVATVNALVAKLRFTRGQLDAGGDHHTVAPSNPNRDCVWRCQFVRMCPLMDDGSDWRALLGSQYIQQDPYHYYESDAQRTLAALGPGDGSMAVEDE